MVSAEKTVTKQTQTDVHSVLTLVKREWKSSNAWKIRTEEEVRIGIHTLDTKTDAPQGYQQSEQKCSNEEKRHGCKDIRLESGLGCVRR